MNETTPPFPAGDMTIKGDWENFERIMIPKAAEKMQRFLMRRAFYAGFYDSMHAQKDLITSNLSADKKTAAVETYLEECRAFNEAMQRGEV